MVEAPARSVIARIRRTAILPGVGPSLSELDAGIVRVTMPLPWALDHVHCYAVPGASGWTLIDCGLGTRATLGWWREALDQLDGRPVERVVITHYHPDHIGASAELVELTGAEEVVQGRLDRRLAVEAWIEDDGGAFERYLAGHGMPAEMAAESANAESRTAVHPAEPTLLVAEGDTIELGGEPHRVLELPGHADGHIALLGLRSRRLFGGDVLLDEITPNVGRWPDTAVDPLGRYLETLGRISGMAPSIVLPGHGPAISDAAARAGEIAGHHHQRLDDTAAALAGGAETAYETAQLIWADEPLGFHEQRFALVEAISHLERLEAVDRAVQRTPRRWQPIGT
jgi:glyoxylase-like metal-dependent hydrolase (beta-lactamase superfamily II)